MVIEFCVVQYFSNFKHVKFVNETKTKLFSAMFFQWFLILDTVAHSIYKMQSPKDFILFQIRKAITLFNYRMLESAYFILLNGTEY